jgi:hypothetical protein
MKLNRFATLFALLFTLSANSQIANFEWAKRIVNTGTYKPDDGSDIQADQFGNLYIVGDFYDTLNVNGDLLYNQSTFHDAFLIKTKSDGTPLWALPIGTGGIDYGRRVLVSENGDRIYIAGQASQGPCQFGDAQSGIITRSYIGSADYVACIDSSGQMLWANVVTGTQLSMGPGLTADDSGNVYLGGFSYDNSALTIQASNGNFNSNIAGSFYAMYLTKFNSNGAMLQRNIERGATYYGCWAMDYSAHENALYVTGTFRDSCWQGNNVVAHSNGTEDAFIAKYTTALQPLWLRNYGGSMVQSYLEMYKDVRADAEGHAICIGTFYGQLIIGNDTLNGNNSNSAQLGNYLVEFDNAGNPVWSEQVIGTSFAFDELVRLRLGREGEIYISGSFYTPVYYQSNTLNGPYPGSFDIGVLKTDSTGNFRWFKAGGEYLNDYSGGLCIAGNGAVAVTGSLGEISQWTFDSTYNTPNGNGGYYDIVYARIFDEEAFSGTGVSENQSVINDLEVYPNPSSGQLNINAAFPCVLSVTDNTGKLVLSKTLNSSAVDLSTLPDGSYFISVEDDSSIRTAQVVIVE